MRNLQFTDWLFLVFFRWQKWGKKSEKGQKWGKKRGGYRGL